MANAIRVLLSLMIGGFIVSFGLGVMLQEFGDLERAARAYDQALALNPHHEHAKAARERLAGSGIGQTL